MSWARVELDFTRPAGRLTRGEARLLVAGVAALLLVLLALQHLGARHQDLQARLSALDGRRPAPAVPVDAALSRELQAERAKLDSVAARMSVPWDRLFADLESATAPGVLLRGLQREGEGRRLRLTGEGRRFEDVVAYARRLEATPAFGAVLLLSHELQAGRVVFVLSAQWGDPS